MERAEPGRSLAEVLDRRKLVSIVTGVVALCVAIAGVLLVHPKYGSIAHVLLINDAGGRDPITAGPDMPAIATSTSVIAIVKDRLHLSTSVTDLQKAVTAHVAPRSSIMSIAFRSRSASEAIAVPNAVADAFVEFYSGLPQERSRGVMDSLARDLAVSRQNVLSIERHLEEASAGNSYVGSQASLDNLGRAIGELHEQRGAAAGQLASDAADMQNQMAQPGKLAKIVRHEILNNNPEFRELQLGVARDSSAFTSFRSGVTDRFPGIAGGEAKIAQENRALAAARERALSSPDAYSPSEGGAVVALDKARSNVAGDRVHLAALDAQIASAEAELHRAASSADSSLGSLRAQRDTAEAQFQALALRYSNAEANSAESNSLGRAVVVDRAVRAEPSLLGPNVLLAVGFALALALAVAAAYIAEAVDPRLLSPNDVESVYGRPTLVSLRKQ
jgi:uncharacterized protein involved in exopolysaccharide biosynthesis